jgi:hypothetical protein
MLLSAAMVTGLLSELHHFCTLVLSIMQSYVNTCTHKASLPNQQELPDVWAQAASTLTLLQLGVGMWLWFHVCESQGGVQLDPCVSSWA